MPRCDLMWLTTVDFCATRCYSRTLLRVARVCLLPTLYQVKRTETVRVAGERAEPGMSGVWAKLDARDSTLKFPEFATIASRDGLIEPALNCRR
ncbi:protein of unknown function (plasmid) [Cupriavidus taiwanensis]|uniref:Uncharacterized protein n=1 Tax=Cupriavidus taiwanensis TaxID=164546 RepID=A0A375I5W9_9BURK|nr:hypothetical protein CT19425_U380028 [Cupriavidus taiwanensis]SPK77691.1 protein of unknown function [Cupriavidus taiwanensis]